MLCLKCGQREQFADNLCEECLTASIKPVSLPPVLQTNFCRVCHRVQRGKSWHDPESDLPEAAVRLAESSVEIERDVTNTRVEFSVDTEDNNRFILSGRASSVYKGVIINQKLTCEVRLHPQACPWCSRQQGSYYEAILQIRGLDGLSEEQVYDLVSKIRDDTYLASLKDPNIFVTKEEKVRGGYDFYIGENSYARQISQKLHDAYGGEIKVSSSLFGRKDGRDLLRYTYLVRLPGFLAGDYLAGEKGPYKVLRVHKRVNVLELGTGRETTISLQEAMAMRPLKQMDVEVELVVVMDSKNEVQVLHPSTMRPIDLVKVREVDVKDTVRGAVIDNDIYLV
ncbi:MAG: 60S ribosomal export protein NMD3 [Thermoplasmatota archaeon]